MPTPFLIEGSMPDADSLAGGLRQLINFVTELSVQIYGEITISANATTMTLTSDHAWVPVTSNWTSDVTPLHCTIDTTNGRITPLIDGVFAIPVTVGFTSAESPAVIEFALFKDGTIVPGHIATTWLDSTTFPNTVTLTGIDSVSAGSVFDIRAHSTAAVGDLVITVLNANLSIWSI